ncbi:MAG TPA: hypothetical protein VNG51_19325 [Ktedonobacteraceae bacterium]|nr:hypothetical protein [Ktedonobacteraceae bacterium]
MSYIVTLRDGTTHRLDNENGLSLRDTWESAKHPFPARLGDGSVLSSQIVSIAKEQLTQPDWLTSEVIQESKRIEAKDHCRGQYSIQKQINDIAHDEGGHVTGPNPEGLKWSKLIQDTAWREKVRSQLRGMNNQWCDYRAGECACESEYLSDKARHNPEEV